MITKLDPNLPVYSTTNLRVIREGSKITLVVSFADEVDSQMAFQDIAEQLNADSMTFRFAR